MTWRDGAVTVGFSLLTWAANEAWETWEEQQKTLEQSARVDQYLLVNQQRILEQLEMEPLRLENP